MRFRFENSYETELEIEQVVGNEFRFEPQSVPEFRITEMGAWYEWLLSIMDFLWIGNINGNNMLSILDNRFITITGTDFASSFIPSTSTATFTLPNDADYVADDWDNFWFTGGVSNAKMVAELANPTLSRTVILYSNDLPFNIYAIGVLRNSVVLTDAQREQLGYDFQLWLFYSEII